MKTHFFLIIICTLVLSRCSENTNGDRRKDGVAEELKNFLERNRYNVIDLRLLEDFSRNNDSFEITKFIRAYDNRELESQNRIDTIAKAAGLELFPQHVRSHPDSEIIRMIRMTTAFGKNEVIIVQARYTEGNTVLIEKYVLSPANGENPFMTWTLGEEAMRTDFQIDLSVAKEIKIEEWNELREIMRETDMLTTSYHENRASISICHAYHYILEYEDRQSVIDTYFRLEKSCPGDMTAISLVSEKLIEYFKD